jgi:hypothetical protein
LAEAHALHLGVDVIKTNWREALLGWVRHDVICKGDQPTYKAAYETSNGLEHGSLDMPSIRAVAQQVTPKLFGYVRAGVLDLLNLEAAMRERLGKLGVLDVTPLHMQMKGVLTGDVADTDQLGFESDPYPRMDPQLTLDKLTYQSDGRLTVSPRYTYSIHSLGDRSSHWPLRSSRIRGDCTSARGRHSAGGGADIRRGRDQ